MARRAGVSRTVASRAMNNTRDVSAAKREAVRQAAQELGYAPNSSARALATRRVGSVVLAVVDEEPALFSDPFFSQVVVGITTVLARAELDLTLMLASSLSSRERLERLLRSPDTDGVMMMAPRGDDPLVRVADNSAVPVVFGGRPLHGRAEHYIDVDNRGGARRAVEHLVAAGRRRIAEISGPMGLEASVARHRGSPTP
nr:LacI family DNA-binding transcriptional regulator [Brachybacterium sp. Z12]